jgi:hypothetical protein
MNLPQTLAVPGRTRSRLRRLLESEIDSPAIMWRINGYRASLLMWSRDEWAKLEARPSDAQYHPSGIWCALRID